MSDASGASAAASAPVRPPSLLKVLSKYAILGLILTSVLMFVSGRSDWWRAWMYIGFTLGLQLLAGVVLYLRSPDLLVERSRIREGTEPWDRILVPLIAGVGPVFIWATAAWDVRIHWPPAVPVIGTVAAYVVCVLGFALTFWAMLTNRFFSATVRIQSERGHVVVDGGPYAYVRHPGYTGALAFTVATPMALGSWYAFIPAVLTAAVLALRTALEDRTLRLRLDGYATYSRRVKKRLLPGIW